jgi:Zn-dependent protease with chaperone function
VPYDDRLVQQRKATPSAPVVVAAVGACAGGLVALLVVLVAGPVAAAVAFVVVGVGVGAACWFAPCPYVVRLLGGTPPNLAEVGQARLANLVESVAVAVGVPEPRLRVVDDPGPNALVTGPDPRRTTLIVTSGLLERLDRLALEAVIAQQLSIVRAGSTLRRDVAVVVLGTFGRVVPALRLLAAAAARDADADLTAVGVTRYPPGLLAALEAVAAGPEVGGPPILAPMWFVPPGTAADLDLRLETMRELV